MVDMGRNLIEELIELNGDVRELQRSTIVRSHIAPFHRRRMISIKHSKTIEEKGEGLPSLAKVKMVIDPDITDNFESATLQNTLTDIFDDPWEIFGAFRACDPSRSLIPVNNPIMMWRQVILLIATHRDSGRDLQRVICFHESERLSSDEFEELSITRLIIDIESIKVAPPDMYEHDSALIFVRFARDTGFRGKFSEEIIESGKELSTAIGSQLSIHVSCEELQYGLSLLQSNSTCIDRNYLSTWKLKSPFNLNKFEFSFLRPPLKPDFPLEVQRNLIKEEKLQRKIERDRVRSEKKVEFEKVMAYEAARKLAVRISSNKKNLLCSWADCEKQSMHRCSVCHSAYYCSKEHQQEHWRLRHRDECVPAPALKSIPASHEDEDQPLITQPPSGFNPLIDLHPTSVGPGSVAPIDIWDDRIGDISVCLDLNDVVKGGSIPMSKYKEHEMFWIRVQIPLLGDGTQLIIDEHGTLKLDLTKKNSMYTKIRDCVKTKGYKGLKGFFPARRHGDFLRIYLEDINTDRSKNW